MFGGQGGSIAGAWSGVLAPNMSGLNGRYNPTNWSQVGPTTTPFSGGSPTGTATGAKIHDLVGTMPTAWKQNGDAYGLTPARPGYLVLVDRGSAIEYTPNPDATQERTRYLDWISKGEPACLRSVGSVNEYLRENFKRVQAQKGGAPQMQAWLRRVRTRSSTNPSMDKVLGLKPSQNLTPEELDCISYGITRRFTFIGISGGFDSIQKGMMSVHEHDAPMMMNYIVDLEKWDVVKLYLISKGFGEPFQYVPLRCTTKIAGSYSKSGDTDNSFLTFESNGTIAPALYWDIGTVVDTKEDVLPEVYDSQRGSNGNGNAHLSLEIDLVPCVKIRQHLSHGSNGMSYRATHQV